MRKLLILAALLALAPSAESGILRYTYRAKDSSANPSARMPQFIVADTEAECPATDVGDGDMCYGVDTDDMLVRTSGAWVDMLPPAAGSITLAGDVDGAENANDIDEASVEGELEGVLDLPDLQGILTAAKGGTGIDSGALTGIARATAGTWTLDAGVSHLAGSTSASLRGVLSDELGTGPALFGIDEAMADDMTTCTGSQVLRRDAGDTAWECATISGGSTPTGTGFRHVTGGAEDAASVLVNLTDAAHVAANQGTTTQVLHGNAAGQASWAVISLTTDMGDSLSCTGDQVVRRNAGDTLFECYTPGGGSGDVVGPASATDNALVRFDTTTGKLVQNSAVTVDDVGNIRLGDGTVSVPSLAFTADADFGFYRRSATTFALVNSARNVISFGESGGGQAAVQLQSDGYFGWVSSATDSALLTATLDTYLTRSAAGKVQIQGASGLGALRLSFLDIADSVENNYYTVTRSDLAADRNVNLPLLGADDVFVFEAHTQTLTNKTLTAAANVIEADSGDSATGFFGAGQIEAARGGTGADSSASTGVPRVASGTWSFDAGVSHLAASTSASLRGVLSDELGTGPALFGIDEAMADDMTSCTGSQVLRRDAGDTAWECATISGGGAPTTAKYVVAEADGTLSAEIAPAADHQIPSTDTATTASWKTLSNGAVSYATGTHFFSQAGVSNLAASSSADLAGVLSDEEGSAGGFVRATSPVLTTPEIAAGSYTLGTEAAAPGTPAAGKVILYAKSGTPGEWCSKDDAGTETCMSAGGGASDPSLYIAYGGL